jgi:hypothetical protein
LILIPRILEYFPLTSVYLSARIPATMMLKTIDILIGISVVMLLVSMIVTVITQVISTLLNQRGKRLMKGISDLLRQIDPELPTKIADQIATGVLTHPMVRSSKGRLGEIIHREELTKLLLELASGEGPQKLDDAAITKLQAALVKNGVCKAGDAQQIQSQISDTLKNLGLFALQLELSHPELTNAARARIATLQQANSQFLAKINLWFDQTMDRVSERFTSQTRYVTFATGLVLALLLQLDTAALVSRLSTDPALRDFLLNQAIAIERNPPRNASQPALPAAPASSAQPDSSAAAPQTAAGSGQPTGAPAQEPMPSAAPVMNLNATDRQAIRDLMLNNVVGIPEGFDDWTRRWTADNWAMKLMGIVLTALLLSLGAPFWYNALQNLIRLRSVIASKDDQQREERQLSAPTATAAGMAGAAEPDTGVRKIL